MAHDNAEYLKLVKDYIKSFINQVNYATLLYGFIDYARFITYAKIFSLFYDTRNARILDVGCGAGGMSVALRILGANPIGVDIDSVLIRMAKVRIPKEEFFVSGGYILPFSDNTFDGVILLHVLEHVKEPQTVVDEVNRILRPGGILLMECPNRIYPFEPHQKLPLITIFPKPFSNLLSKLLTKMPFVNDDLKTRCLLVAETLPNFISFFTLRRMAHNAGFDILGANELNYKIRRQIAMDKESKFHIRNQNLIPICGDWNGDRIDSVGLFDSSDGTLYLKNSNDDDKESVISYRISKFSNQIVPIIGDWDGDGIDSIGVFNKSDGTFSLGSNNVDTSYVTFSFGLISKDCVPIVGDWDGDGVDTIGIYDTSKSIFYLRNSNSSGDPDISFNYGGIKASIPIVGDWDGDGVDTIGIYELQSGSFFLRDSNSAGYANCVFTPDQPSSKSLPISGDWDGDGKDTVGLYDKESCIFHLFASNHVSYIEKSIRDRLQTKFPFLQNLSGRNTLLVCKKIHTVQ